MADEALQVQLLPRAEKLIHGGNMEMVLYVILRWVLNALVLMLLTHFFKGIEISTFYTALIVALALGIVNALIRPIFILLTLPINILTLGLFTLVINALMFWFVSTFIKGFTVTNFWSAFFGALLFSLFAILLNFIDQKTAPKSEGIGSKS